MTGYRQIPPPPPDDEDDLGAARGFVNGLILSAIVWGIVLWILRVCS